MSKKDTDEKYKLAIELVLMVSIWINIKNPEKSFKFGLINGISLNRNPQTLKKLIHQHGGHYFRSL